MGYISCFERFLEIIHSDLQMYNRHFDIPAQERFRKEVVFYGFMDLLGYTNFSVSKITESAIAIYDSLQHINNSKKKQSIEIILRSYSDNIGLIIPINLAELFYSPSPKTVWSILRIATIYQLSMVLNGFALRGSLCIGTLLFNDDIMAGKVLIKAYELEKERAKYPRIILDDIIVRYLKCLRKYPLVESKINNGNNLLKNELSFLNISERGKKDLIRLITDWNFFPNLAILKDSDGIYFLNYLWQFAEILYNAMSLPFFAAKIFKSREQTQGSNLEISALYSEEDIKNVCKIFHQIYNELENHYKFIVKNLSNVEDEKVKEKYFWLSKYHDFFVDNFIARPIVKEIINSLCQIKLEQLLPNIKINYSIDKLPSIEFANI